MTVGRALHRVRPAGTYFITVDSWGGRQLFKAEVAEILTDQMIQCRENGHFLLHEFCVLYNHLHTLFTPPPDSTLEKCIQMVKGGASFRIGKVRKFPALWQKGYFDWRCRDEDDYKRYAEYIRQNPVKAGLVEKAEDWPYSSANPRFTGHLDPMPQGLKAGGIGQPVMSTLKG
jgi:putative transposase